jgi:hypothetical protein
LHPDKQRLSGSKLGLPQVTGNSESCSGISREILSRITLVFWRREENVSSVVEKGFGKSYISDRKISLPGPE